MGERDVTSTETAKASCWPWGHKWSKWADKTWSKLVRDPVFATYTTTAPAEVGLECIQERRCQRCNMLQLRSERTQL